MFHHKNRLRNLVVKICDEFLAAHDSDRQLAIFLCGGMSRDQDRLRIRLGRRLTELKKSPYRYSIHYPEEMFEELVLGTTTHNYLELENHLAASANAVVILLASPGTFAELGAFSNRSDLKEKLVVLVERKYRGDKSFLAKGPIRYLEKNTKSQVEYLSFANIFQDKNIYRISELCRRVSKESNIDLSLANPIRARDSVLAMIHTFEPLPRDALISLAQLQDAREAVQVSVESIVNIIVNRGFVRLRNRMLSITNEGKAALLAPTADRLLANLVRERILSDCRCEALDLIIRKRRSRNFWRGSASV